MVKRFKSLKAAKTSNMPKEEELLKKTADLWNTYIKLDNISDCESFEVASAIHVIQGRLAIRMHQRDVKESPFIK